MRAEVCGLEDVEDDGCEEDHLDPASAAAELAGTWNFSGFDTGQLVLQVPERHKICWVLAVLSSRMMSAWCPSR